LTAAALASSALTAAAAATAGGVACASTAVLNKEATTHDILMNKRLNIISPSGMRLQLAAA
jgi:hypothetical protein